jgi:PAS domain-containing protein
MDQRIFIAQLNIEHYRRRLDGDLDDAHRRVIERLLGEEEAKLSALRTVIAEGVLSSLLDLLAVRAASILDPTKDRALHSRRSELATIFDEMPFAMSLIDGSGTVVMANDAMRGLFSQAIPPRDPQRIARSRLFGSDGGALDPEHWPAARALRGESVNPGLAALHVDDDGRETPLRIAAVPVRTREGSIGGAIGAAYQLSALERRDVHDLLDRMLLDEQFHARRRGLEGSQR